MKKQLLLITSFVLIVTAAFGGGIVTNSNQSAYWVRTLVRDAAIGPDAVYFNPAGLTRMDDGFHFSLNSQTIFQSKDVTNNYPYLNPTPKKYKGEIKVPVFPSAYATWKKDKIAISFGFNPIGGGGGAEYKTGLPSFETEVTGVAAMAKSYLVMLNDGLTAGYGFNPQLDSLSGYNADIYFKGTSKYMGYQLGVTYAITDVFSAYIGGRFVAAKNTYEGHISDIQIYAETNPLGVTAGLYDLPSGYYAAGNYFRGVAAATGIEGTATEALMLGAAAGFDAATADVEVDAEEQGNGFAPILGLNISPNDNLNIGLKYEFKTKVDLKTTVNDNKGGGLFLNDSTVHSDLPAMFSVGVWYRIIPSLSATAGFHYYFDKSANYGKTLDLTGEEVDNDKVIDKNYFEIGLSLEYSITEKFLVSAGYLYAKPGVTMDYHSEMSYALPSSTVGFGFGIKFTEKVMANLGAMYTKYKEEDKTQVDFTTGVSHTNTFFKSNLIFGLGLDFSF